MIPRSYNQGLSHGILRTRLWNLTICHKFRLSASEVDARSFFIKAALLEATIY